MLESLDCGEDDVELPRSYLSILMIMRQEMIVPIPFFAMRNMT